jgi:clan AA aspartic protease (TIGR02281 family)
LESEGYSPYFTDQIKRIKAGMGGQYAKDAAAEDAPLQPAQPGQTLVKGTPDAGTLDVPVSIDGAPAMSFIVDSGASLISIPWDDAEPFMKTGLIKRGDYQGERPFQLADGTTVSAEIYRLGSVKVGDSEVKDVLAAIYRGHGPRLLGQSFLKRFKSWSIDNKRGVLVLTR